MVGPTQSRARRILRKAAIYLAIFAVMWVGALYALQDRLIFPRELAGAPLREALIPAQAQRLWLDIGDDARVEAWYFPADLATPDHPAPAVLFCHGNAELIDHNLNLVARYHSRGYGVLVPEFRGYGRSGGSPSQKNLVADAAAFYDLLVKRPEVDAARVIIHGRSIGTGIAAQLSSAHQPAALILESPFTSIAALTWRYAVPPFLLRHPFHTDRVLPTLTCPILILHGRSDEVVPFSHGIRLHELAPGSTFLEMDGSHNSGLSEQDVYWRAVDKLVAGLASPAPTPPALPSAPGP